MSDDNVINISMREIAKEQRLRLLLRGYNLNELLSYADAQTTLTPLEEALVQQLHLSRIPRRR